METGVHSLPNFVKDTTDRNRTSPFAFTGNKFEFRMCGSALSIAGPNIILNTIVADELDKFADVLEKADDVEKALNELIRDTVREHKRIIFNGNNYSDEWVEEAEKRGLLNLKTAPDAFPYFKHEKNINLFLRHGIFTPTEVCSRCEILLDNYNKAINIEALTMIDMARKDILPASVFYVNELAQTLCSKKSLSLSINCGVEEALITKLSALNDSLYERINELEESLVCIKDYTDVEKLAIFCKEKIVTNMNSLREVADEIETLVANKYWPYPNYADLIFGVQ